MVPTAQPRIVIRSIATSPGQTGLNYRGSSPNGASATSGIPTFIRAGAPQAVTLAS
jgi:hypothetical protein